MESWFLIEHDLCEPAWNMACDEWLMFHSHQFSQPILRTYRWDRPSMTIGYFQPFPKDISLHDTVIRRPTGGALVIHDHDLTFTVVISPQHAWYRLPVHERYQCVHERVHKIFEQRGLSSELMPPHKESPVFEKPKNPETDRCFTKSSRYDVLVRGIKVAGGAQRFTRHGLLHQGSIQGEKIDRVSSAEIRSVWEKYGAQFLSLKLSTTQESEITTLAAQKFSTIQWNHRV